MLAFVFAYVLDWAFSHGLQRGLGLHPAAIFRGEVWRLLGFTILHHQVWQLVANALVFWIVARRIEDKWGTGKFLALCIACSLATAAVALAAHAGKEPYLGASGMVLGLVLTYASLFRRRPVAGLPAVQLASALAAIAALAAFQPRALMPAWGAAGAGVLTAAMWIALEPRAIRWRAAYRRRRRIRAQCQIAEIRGAVDVILDKINSAGMDSLTRQELSTLRRASRLFAGHRAES